MEKEKNKNYLIRILVILLIVVILSVLFMPIYYMNYKTKTISEIYGDNNYKIVLKTIGESGFPFGDAKVKVTLYNDKNKKIDSFVAIIKNDGKNIGEENISVDWLEEKVEITLIGEEQEDKIYEMNY